ncbi:hypothetical protein [Algicola sagamiensis]|uniref:hypothetical protein n=1 Tax=Algicola sagamiensis TaxID=163869 RepID=UPI00037E10B6|nr:hypothetical protein [Algicola sagamiensis]
MFTILRIPTLEEDFWTLRSGEKCHNENPDSFWIPELEKRESLKVGDAAKLIFDIEGYDEDGNIEIMGERIYVVISEVIGDFYIGILDSQPACLDPEDDFYLGLGVEVPFKAEHIIDIDRPPQEYIDWQLSQPPKKRWER